MTASQLERVQESLTRRMKTMFSLYHDAIETMDLHHVNHVEVDGRLPIAFSLFHYVNLHDEAFAVITGEPTVWNEDWQTKVQAVLPFHGKDESVETMNEQRIGDLDAFADYQRHVFDRTEAHLATMDPDDFDRILVTPPYPSHIEGTYSARCAGPEGITVLDAFECWHYQHGLRHIGEIELARGFLGLGGLTA